MLELNAGSLIAHGNPLRVGVKSDHAIFRRMLDRVLKQEPVGADRMAEWNVVMNDAVIRNP